MMKVPSAVHEQNSYPGLTNRLLARAVDCCFVSFEESVRFLKCRRIVLTGNPVREEFFAGVSPSDSGAAENRKNIDSPFTVLVVGGSQGAIAVNEAVVEAVRILKRKGSALRVIHQTGKKDFERISLSYSELNADVEVSAFIYDMAAAYRRADLVVGRAGATTIFELAAIGKPSILIPYPFAANNHQEANARSLVKAGAAEMVLQRYLGGELLSGLIMKYMADPARLSAMSGAALGIARPDAAAAIVDGLMEMALL
jgi:UDP-N-acetylglucosamine--N-acetylmuramyl-(pentapeptide) pyrophosphoryl-undecaprenol N-acetylglucosamine transferase